MSRFFVPALFLMLPLVLGACSSTPPPGSAGPTPPATSEALPALINVRLATTAGDITVELDREHAPISVDNFLKYAERGEYDGTIFHRVIPTFVIQGGGFTGGGASDLIERAKSRAAEGHPDTTIKNEWMNGLKNIRGTIAMARDADPDTATREFYLNVQDNPKLDSPRDITGNAGYAVFGRVIEGMDVVDAIRAGETKAMPEKDMKDVPVKPVVILSVRRVPEATPR